MAAAPPDIWNLCQTYTFDGEPSDVGFLLAAHYGQKAWRVEIEWGANLEYVFPDTGPFGHEPPWPESTDRLHRRLVCYSIEAGIPSPWNPGEHWLMVTRYEESSRPGATALLAKISLQSSTPDSTLGRMYTTAVDLWATPWGTTGETGEPEFRARGPVRRELVSDFGGYAAGVWRGLIAIWGLHRERPNIPLSVLAQIPLLVAGTDEWAIRKREQIEPFLRNYLIGAGSSREDTAIVQNNGRAVTDQDDCRAVDGRQVEATADRCCKGEPTNVVGPAARGGDESSADNLPVEMLPHLREALELQRAGHTPEQAARMMNIQRKTYYNYLSEAKRCVRECEERDAEPTRGNDDASECRERTSQ